MSSRSYAFNYFVKIAPRDFKDSYMFKRGDALNTLGIFETQRKYQELKVDVHIVQPQEFEGKSLTRRGV